MHTTKNDGMTKGDGITRHKKKHRRRETFELRGKNTSRATRVKTAEIAQRTQTGERGRGTRNAG
jgi:hypothetical protein